MPGIENNAAAMKESANAGYSPRLCNDDLAPTRHQTWSWYNIFSFWMSDVHSMGGYVVAASFFTLGLASWQVLICLAGRDLHRAVLCQPGRQTQPDGGRTLRGDLPPGFRGLRRQYSGGDPRAYRLRLVRDTNLPGR